MDCKTCGKVYHWCGSCGEDELLSNGFCSEKCFKQHAEFLEIKNNLDYLYQSFSEEQRAAFVKFIDNYWTYELTLDEELKKFGVDI